ncbi:jg8006 [Pararge aegeria aegeria]|uniref:Jg8006 protein n=1 Tax=Pararge aegeria aegeria TaxID=348720 RepID=A0A8S4RFX7_9NEOP|nr:jg8006 [Pararge aegeria aegeria]
MRYNCNWHKLFLLITTSRSIQREPRALPRMRFPRRHRALTNAYVTRDDTARAPNKTVRGAARRPIANNPSGRHVAATLAPRHAFMEPAFPASPPSSESGSESGEETVVPGDPAQWQQEDVARCVQWVARTFSVPAPGRLLPASGAQLLQLSEDDWLRVCEGGAQAARIFHAYLQHAHAAATGRAPPPPLPEHQATSSTAQPRKLTLILSLQRLCPLLLAICVLHVYHGQDTFFSPGNR